MVLLLFAWRDIGMWIKKEIGNLEKIADKFRANDIYFKDLEIEERTMLNATGKILGELSRALLTYQYSDDEKKLEIRKKIVKLWEVTFDTWR